MKFDATVLNSAQVKVLKQVAPVMAAKEFYLGGGTAVALYFWASPFHRF